MVDLMSRCQCYFGDCVRLLVTVDPWRIDRGSYTAARVQPDPSWRRNTVSAERGSNLHIDLGNVDDARHPRVGDQTKQATVERVGEVGSHDRSGRSVAGDTAPSGLSGHLWSDARVEDRQGPGLEITSEGVDGDHPVAVPGRVIRENDRTTVERLRRLPAGRRRRRWR